MKITKFLQKKIKKQLKNIKTIQPQQLPESLENTAIENHPITKKKEEK